MAASRHARRERPERANAALQSLKRELLPCGLRLALARLGRSEIHHYPLDGVLASSEVSTDGGNLVSRLTTAPPI